MLWNSYFYYNRIYPFCYRTDDLKFGQLVGSDKYGNKYYENNMYFYGKIAIFIDYILILLYSYMS